MDFEDALNMFGVEVDEDGSLLLRTTESDDLGCGCFTDFTDVFEPVTIEYFRDTLRVYENSAQSLYASAARVVISELERVQVSKADGVHGSVLDGAL